jgi:predicted nucleotidyltransferase
MGYNQFAPSAISAGSGGNRQHRSFLELTKTKQSQLEQAQWDQLAARLRPTFEKRRVLRAIVFGSLARGEASRRSDLDLIVIQNTEKRFLDRYDDLLRDVTQAVPGRDIDMLIYTPQELNRMAHRPFIAAALREGKTIYESSQEPASG